MYAIVIPTYNEKENIVELVKKIDSLYGSLNKSLMILVADDNSPDGTRIELEKYLGKRHLRLSVEIITKKDKTGLKDAYFKAFTYMLKKYPSLDGIIQMDADLSHDPKYIKRHLANLENGYDLSCGSRYVSGGSINNWGFGRRLLSRLGNLTNRTILSFRLHDYTGGYNGISRKALKYVLQPDIVTCSGYYFLTEMKYRIITSGFSFIEFPIVFTDRVKGQSKMKSGIILESIQQVIKIRFQKR
jgi:dolichol-phosphate mannosyltransferase